MEPVVPPLGFCTHTKCSEGKKGLLTVKMRCLYLFSRSVCVVKHEMLAILSTNMHLCDASTDNVYNARTARELSQMTGPASRNDSENFGFGARMSLLTTSSKSGVGRCLPRKLHGLPPASERGVWVEALPFYVHSFCVCLHMTTTTTENNMR